MGGLIIVFTFYNINSSLAAGAASEGTADVTHAVSNHATFRDAGSAFGVLTGGLLPAYNHLDLIFTLLSLTLILLTWIYYRQSAFAKHKKSGAENICVGSTHNKPNSLR
ncbi:hypothetical protein [Dyadobacter arcticus]|uniref:Lipoprotein signal peptidase n=1 Tax=Dyadobacter arcticus TaxID=1078754 RepID=A0ABX0URC3_9BACT|nr:hypothetical protein [Dyadobacter arcticus]NIJ55516.1 lipoprotein signal peptidase [Dyadobacter arcticus]